MIYLCMHTYIYEDTTSVHIELHYSALCGVNCTENVNGRWTNYMFSDKSESIILL